MVSIKKDKRKVIDLRILGSTFNYKEVIYSLLFKIKYLEYHLLINN